MSKADDWFAQAQEEIIKAAQQDELEADAEVWDPEAGDLLRGRFVKAVPYWKEYDGKQVLQYRLYVEDVDNKDQLTLVFASRSVLKSEVIDTLPAPETLIAIQYFGPIESATGREYHSYKVRAQETSPRYWQQVAQEAEKIRPKIAPQQSQVGPDMDPY